MTETTPTLLAARDALADVLRQHVHVGGTYWDRDTKRTFWKCQCGGRWTETHQADMLLATVVRDAATLAADETLVEAYRRGYNDRANERDFDPGHALDLAADDTRALAAALGGDRPAPTTEEQP